MNQDCFLSQILHSSDCVLASDLSPTVQLKYVYMTIQQGSFHRWLFSYLKQNNAIIVNSEVTWQFKKYKVIF